MFTMKETKGKKVLHIELENYKRYNVDEQYIKRLNKLMDNEYNEFFNKGDEKM